MTSILQQIGKGTLWTSFGSFIGKGIGVFATFLTLNQLSVYEYGLAELAISVTSLCSIFVLPGIASVVQSEMAIARGRGDWVTMKTLSNQFFRIQVLLAIIPWAAVFFGADIIAHFYNQGIANLFRVVSFAFLVSPFRSTVLIFLRVHIRFKTLAVYGGVEQAIKFVILLFCYFVFHLGVLSVVLGYVLTDFIALLVIAPRYFRDYRPLRAIQESKEKIFWNIIKQHGKWSMMSSYLHNFANNLRLWIIQFFLGTEVVGLYSLATGLLSHVQDLIPLGTILNPIFSLYKDQPAHLFRLVGKGFKYQIIGFIFSAFAALVTLPILIHVLFPKFSGAYPLFISLLPTLVSLGFATILTPLFMALQIQRSFFFATIVKTFAIAIFAPIALSLFGFWGIPLEFFLTNVVFTLERYRVMKKHLQGFRFPFSAMFGIDSDDKLILSHIFPRLGVQEKKF